MKLALVIKFGKFSILWIHCNNTVNLTAAGVFVFINLYFGIQLSRMECRRSDSSAAAAAAGDGNCNCSTSGVNEHRAGSDSSTHKLCIVVPFRDRFDELV